jgi:hypothetical protein
MVLFDVPTGIVADTVGRRASNAEAERVEIEPAQAAAQPA